VLFSFGLVLLVDFVVVCFPVFVSLIAEFVGCLLEFGWFVVISECCLGVSFDCGFVWG